MKILLPHRLVFSGLIVLAFAVVVATNRGQANSPIEEFPDSRAESIAAVSVAALSEEILSTLPPPPEQDPCLHCHIAGSIENEWSPISRWLVFGAMGFTFVFGLSRNFIVWRTREVWHYRWMYYFSSITALVFVFSAITGIIGLILNNSTLEILVRVETIIKAIHWGCGIILFITTLGLSFAGALLPGYQRPFWGMIFIAEIIGSTIAIANLSFAFLYADWHIPPSPSRLYGFHMLLIPMAIASLMSIYIMMQRKRGETQ